MNCKSRVGLCLAAAIPLFAPLAVATIFALFDLAPSWANHISAALDINRTRPTLGPDQGYLIFAQTTAQFPLGEERTGWIDARHPAYFDGGVGNANNILVKDNQWGYDRSDFQIYVNNTIVTHTNNPVGTPNQTAAAGPARIQQDFAYANQIYNQIGITVLNEGIGNANVVVPNAMAAPPAPNQAGMTDSDRVLAVNRSGDALTINNYYTVGYTGGSPVGFTVAPEDTLAPNTRPRHGTILTNAFNRDTFAHEIGHFIEDQYRFQNPGFNVHSPTNTDLMATSGAGAGGPRQVPNANVKGQGNDAPSHPGRPNGNLGGVDRFDATMQNPADAVPRPNYLQPTAIYNAEKDGNLYVRTRDRAALRADRADFDWIEDSYALEDIAGRADNHPGARDGLYFLKGATISAHPAILHDHSNWGELNYQSFTGNTFRFADVFSNVARYTDNDVDAAGNWSPRESVLDYNLQFSADGTNWVNGVPLAVYRDGWTLATQADDWVARWNSPIDAQFVRVNAMNPLLNGHDGNTQIDAIIVSTSMPFLVPEPQGIGTVLLCAVVTALRRRRALQSLHGGDM